MPENISDKRLKERRQETTITGIYQDPAVLWLKRENPINKQGEENLEDQVSVWKVEGPPVLNERGKNQKAREEQTSREPEVKEKKTGELEV